jgi:hypothetical protein
VSAPFKVYVAAASKEISRAETFIQRLRDCGVEITFDWCAHMRAVEGREIDQTLAVMSAGADLDGVRQADLVVLLEPGWQVGTEHGVPTQLRVLTTGAWGEAAVAIALNTPLVVSRPVEPPNRKSPKVFDHCIFLALADLVCEGDDAALRAVLHLALRGELPGVTRRDATPAADAI